MALVFGSTGSDIVSLITGLAWPVLVGVVFVLLLPSIRKTIASRGFTVKAGGMEISVQEASEQLATRLDDLRNRVIGIEDGNGGPGSATAEPPAGPAAAEPPAEPPGPATPPPPAAVRMPSEPQAAAQLRNVLWVDDMPSNNAFEIDALQRKGVHVASAVSSDDAFRALDGNGRFDVIITDMGRESEGRDAGLTLIRDLKAHGVPTPIIVYASASAVSRTREEALRLGAYASTASATELMSLLNTLGLD
jgi:CheY-like chemotaxis protein